MYVSCDNDDDNKDNEDVLRTTNSNIHLCSKDQ